MTDAEVREAVKVAEEYFGHKCKKYSGALMVEIIRNALQQEGIIISNRDVFIRGIPVEVDLILPKKEAIPRDGLSYEPSEVFGVIEIKKSGAYGAERIQGIKKNIEMIRNANPQIICSYLTLSEKKGYKWTVTDDSVGCKTYTMFWHNGRPDERRIYSSTGDWKRFLNDMRTMQQNNRFKI
jgi:hypothetical protein